ncbi:hypothetical protein QP794_23485 [Paenibacillus sp. UMB7766-LJ446]|uniref:hypothetical protein n=1 Tax=Paenibacillus TaxID=44249 RepID=UPI0025514395|nr:hypothetical protein [Paenibacillus sp. UMB7766-LJ446]MDK8193057.1 hypothetical protein [Paenibacillus sp. UMB7766-LJ446]
MKRDIMLLVEEDAATNNVSVYSPDYRLGAVGDTEQEAIACIMDLIDIEITKSQATKKYSSKWVSVPMEQSPPLTAV